MKRKKLNIFLLLFFMTFIGIVNVCANTGTINWNGRIYFSGTGYELVADGDSPTSENATNYPHFRNKYSDAAGSLVCTTGFFVDANIGGTCNVATMTSGSIGSAYIINQYTGKNGGAKDLKTSHSEYYWSEVAVVYYLGEYLNVDTNGTTASGYEKATLYAEYKQRIESMNASAFPNNKTFSQTLNEATAYETKYSNAKYSKNVELSLSATDLKFTAGNDGYYYSQKVYVTDKNGNSDKLTISIDNSNFIKNEGTDTGGKYFQLKIERSKLIGNKLNVKATVTGSYEYYKADYYNCADGYQDLVDTTPTRVYKEGKVEISGQIGITKLVIKKVDENNNFLPGVTIKLENKDKSYSKEHQLTSIGFKIEDLPYGEYTITEIKAPEGYLLSNQVYTATLSESKLSETVTIQNKLTRVEIKKLDKATNKFLPGAVLQIKDEKGNVVKDKDGNNYEWTSGNDAHVIEGLPFGKYYLVEISTIDKYVLSSKEVKFEVTEDDVNVPVLMYNEKNKVKISKKSIVNKEELPGATLEIQDKDGNIVKFCTDVNGKKNTECKWVSTDKPYEIEGMPNGKYYLIETQAPEGYVLNKEKIEFVVDGTKLIVDVEMTNELEVKVPDTLSSRSTLLIAISMFDIALGIGLLTYVKKNKVQE